MSSAIANLLKLAEEKNKAEAEKPKLEIVPAQSDSDIEQLKDDIIKSKSDELSVAKENSLPSTTGITRSFEKHPISPIKDYTKTPNSLTRIILAKGLFRGKSKQIYDYLWSVSRGAVKPIRTFRKTHNEIKQGAGIGSKNTIIDGLRHLEQIGLIKIASSVGVSSGNEYDIFTPDEIGYGDLGELTQLTQYNQFTRFTRKLVIPVQPETGYTGSTQTIENKDTSEAPKTSFKDIEENDDDFALAGFAERFDKAARKLTKKGLNKNDKEKWNELAELLVMELEIAAARTASVSNIPAFLTEHLRRRLLQKSNTLYASKSSNTKNAGSSSKAAKTDPPNSIEPYRAEPLSNEARKMVLKTMQEYIEKGQREFVMSLQENYTTEDWRWLSKKLLH